MSRNALYALVGIILVILVLVLMSNRPTQNQSGIVSPTPAVGTINSDVSPTIAISPTAGTSVSPASASPTLSAPTVQVTVSPITAQ